MDSDLIECVTGGVAAGGELLGVLCLVAVAIPCFCGAAAGLSGAGDQYSGPGDRDRVGLGGGVLCGDLNLDGVQATGDGDLELVLGGIGVREGGAVAVLDLVVCVRVVRGRDDGYLANAAADCAAIFQCALGRTWGRA